MVHTPDPAPLPPRYVSGQHPGQGINRAIKHHFNRPMGKVEAGLAGVAFVGLILQLCSPGGGPFVPVTSDLSTVLLSPWSGFVYVHLVGLSAPMIWLRWVEVFVWSLVDGICCMHWATILSGLVVPLTAWLWLLLLWNWLLKAVVFAIRSVFNLRTLGREWRKPRFWLTPVLALSLCVLWATKVPLMTAFAIAKPSLEHIADEVIAAETRELNTSRFVAPLFHIKGGYRLYERYWQEDPENLPSEYAKIASLEISGLWAHQGYIRDLSRKAGGFEADTFSLAPNSNEHDQELFYIGDGWYVFQNYFD